MKDLFPSLYEVKRLEEVVLFTVGLMANPKPLVNHVYELWNERLRAILRSQEPDTNAKENLKRSGRDINKLGLLSSLYTECTVPLPGTSLRNQHVSTSTSTTVFLNPERTLLAGSMSLIVLLKSREIAWNSKWKLKRKYQNVLWP